MDMQINVGRVERIVRALLGVPTAFSFIFLRHFAPYASFVVLLFGLALTATAFLGHCPVHRVMGRSTYKPRTPPVPPAAITKGS